MQAADAPPRLAAASHAALALGAMRLALGATAFAAAAGVAGAGVAVRQLLLGAAILTLVLLFARDSRPLSEVVRAAAPAPPDAPVAAAWRDAAAGLFPSTVGVSILAASALLFDARLAAVLAGFLAGMGVATLAHAARLLAWERRGRLRLLVERRTRRLYVRETG